MKKILVVLVSTVFFMSCGASFGKNDNKGPKLFGKEKQQNVQESVDQEKTSAVKVKNDIEKKADKEQKEAKGKAEKVKKDTTKQVSDANDAGKKKFLGFAWGKNHAQQLKALDEKEAKSLAKSQEKVAGLEKELADAKAANDTSKVEKIEKKLGKAKQNAAEDSQKIETQRQKIKSKMQE